MLVRARFAAVALAVAGCATVRAAGDAARCEPTEAALAPGAALTPLAGRFVLTMVASAGERRGESVSGYLTLRAAPPGTPGPSAGARTALVGTTDVAVGRVGALRLGDLLSEDPRAPGIAVYEQRATSGAVTVTARLGSVITAPPTPGMAPIEGQHTALFVRRISSGGFAGAWSSGSGDPGSEARGHFCAVRVA